MIQIVVHRLSSSHSWGTVRDQVCRSVLNGHGKSTVSFWDKQNVPRFGIHRIHPVTESNRERHGDGNRYPRGQSQTRSGLRLSVGRRFVVGELLRFLRTRG